MQHQYRFKTCRPLARVITRTNLAITSMFVCMNVSCQFVQHALPNMCSSFCRHAEFKFIFDLKITFITRANSLKILQTTEIHYWPCNPTEPVSRKGQIFGTCWDKCVIANHMSNTNHQVPEVVAPWRVKKTIVTGCLMLLEVKHAPCGETSETRVKTAIQAWTSS